jgi:hypothetical protein
MDSVISVLVRILETIFMVGLVGSAVVLILTSLEDVKSLLPGDEEKKDSTPRTSPAQAQFHASDPVA